MWFYYVEGKNCIVYSMPVTEIINYVTLEKEKLKIVISATNNSYVALLKFVI